MADEVEVRSPDPGTWRAGWSIREWALPVLIRWCDDESVWYVAVHFLCFSISYERWRV